MLRGSIGALEFIESAPIMRPRLAASARGNNRAAWARAGISAILIVSVKAAQAGGSLLGRGVIMVLVSGPHRMAAARYGRIRLAQGAQRAKRRSIEATPGGAGDVDGRAVGSNGKGAIISWQNRACK
jgi:hypothetical protein